MVDLGPLAENELIGQVRYLLPDRERARLTGAPATPGYVWIANHPQYGVIQIPDDPKFITPPEPRDGVWLDDQGVVWQRCDDWAPPHAPESRWYSTYGHKNEFWPDVCRASDVTTWVGLKPLQDKEKGALP